MLVFTIHLNPFTGRVVLLYGENATVIDSGDERVFYEFVKTLRAGGGSKPQVLDTQRATHVSGISENFMDGLEKEATECILEYLRRTCIAYKLPPLKVLERLTVSAEEEWGNG